MGSWRVIKLWVCGLEQHENNRDRTWRNSVCNAASLDSIIHINNCDGVALSDCPVSDRSQHIRLLLTDRQANLSDIILTGRSNRNNVASNNLFDKCLIRTVMATAENWPTKEPGTKCRALGVNEPFRPWRSVTNATGTTSVELGANAKCRLMRLKVSCTHHLPVIHILDTKGDLFKSGVEWSRKRESGWNNLKGLWGWIKSTAKQEKKINQKKRISIWWYIHSPAISKLFLFPPLKSRKADNDTLLLVFDFSSPIKRQPIKY